MSTTCMIESTPITTSSSLSEEEAYTCKLLIDMLMAKYPSYAGEKAAQYMGRLLTLREGSNPESKLFVETEILMLFLLLRSLRNEIKKAQNNNQDTQDLKSGYEHNSQRFGEMINKWIDLNVD